MKKVLLTVVDALSSDVVAAELAANRLPTLRKLVSVGALVDSCTSIFPSITPAATASLVTGRYPLDHGIAGAFWYDEAKDDVAYYGDDFWSIMNKGIGRYFNDFLRKLNYDRLRTETIFETVENAGRTAACINYLWFRGQVEHQVSVPLLLKLLPGVPFSEVVHGPSTLFLGDFVQSADSEELEEVGAEGGVFHRYGFEDSATASCLFQLASKGLPDFTLAYFPDNDFDSHERGRMKAAETLREFDEQLGKIIGIWPSINAFLNEVAVVIVGDHSQSDLVADEKLRRISLEQVLNGYRLTAAGKQPTEEDQLVVCPNMRAAQVYYQLSDLNKAGLVEQLLEEPRVDQVMWRHQAADGKQVFSVATSDRGQIEFQRSDENAADAKDLYGNFWSWQGSLETIDGNVSTLGTVEFDQYPNAFERIEGGFCDEAGSLWITARPGYEFALSDTEIHQASSHGSLHVLDSTSPMITAGIPKDIPLPDHVRTVDVPQLCLAVLEITP